MLELIKRSLETGEDVLISSFGKFCIKKKRERRGRNPSTGETMMMRPRKVVTFRSSIRKYDNVFTHSGLSAE
jgi:integration host factor subunit alpha